MTSVADFYLTCRDCDAGQEFTNVDEAVMFGGWRDVEPWSNGYEALYTHIGMCPRCDFAEQFDLTHPMEKP